MFSNASLYLTSPVCSGHENSTSRVHPPSSISSDDQVIDGFTFLR